MQSKVKFDLNGLQEAVISAEITLSDDVRDKIAKNFIERLGHNSNLAFIHLNYQIINVGFSEQKTTYVEIKPFDGGEQGSIDLCSMLSFEQIRSLSKALTSELEHRTLENNK